MSKKILIIINNLGVGGAERLVVDDINEMLRMGTSVELITLKSESKKSLAAQLHLEQDKFHCILFKHFFDISSWVKLVRSIKAFEPDLVITQLWFANTIGRIARMLAGAKTIISFEQIVSDSVKTRKMIFVDWWLQFITTKTIAVSKAVKKSLIKHSIAEERIDVLYNSIDLRAFQAPYHGSEVRVEYGIDEHAFLYIYIGRLVHQKAVDILIEAFKKIDTGAYLLIVGQGKDRNTLEHEVKKSSLEKRVIFAGVRSDIPRLLLSSDCFVLPSRYEGLPLVLIEALAAGSAIIVSDFEGAREVITHEKNGLVVPIGDIVALTQAMTRIKDDSELRSSLVFESKKSAQRFSISHHVHTILRYINI